MQRSDVGQAITVWRAYRPLWSAPLCVDCLCMLKFARSMRASTVRVVEELVREFVSAERPLLSVRFCFLNSGWFVGVLLLRFSG